MEHPYFYEPVGVTRSETLAVDREIRHLSFDFRMGLVNAGTVATLLRNAGACESEIREIIG